MYPKLVEAYEQADQRIQFVKKYLLFVKNQLNLNKKYLCFCCKEALEEHLNIK
jgi:hypothetical protein